MSHASVLPTKSHSPGIMLLGLAALGVVFGDIGTSPLYTLKTVLSLAGGQISPDQVLGLLSLLFWTLILVTSVKYVAFAMRIDNNGEGGILALMSMLGIKYHKRPLIVTAGLFGAALLYGDGAITPAISVLSALEGLNIVFPAAKPYVLPATVAILTLLFALQPLGTARIGKIFGPVMALWFCVLALLGIWGIMQHPAVLLAINPLYGLKFLFSNGYVSFLVLGGVFLCVTGAEALYADMGHFGVAPIRRAWFFLVFPSLLLNYAGQTALVLTGADIADNIFYRLCPQPLLIPLVALATLATIIASQAIITGAFSITRMAIQLGWLPRIRIKQTSAEGYGQIYVGPVNWLLMIVTISLVLVFKSSDNLAAAYGIAVSLTMLLTSLLLFIAMREIWQWSRWSSLLVAGGFIIIDSCFVLTNMVKVVNGGYVPLLLACFIFATMLLWHRGIEAVARKNNESLLPLPQFIAEIEQQQIPRVPGTAIFMTRTSSDTPPVMQWHIRCNHSLHRQLFALHVQMENVPWVEESKRLTLTEVATNFWRLKARYGFMEHPNIPHLFKQHPELSAKIAGQAVTYYLSYETIVHDNVDPTANLLPAWQSKLFAAMVRNSTHITDYFSLPTEGVVEIGKRISI